MQSIHASPGEFVGLNLLFAILALLLGVCLYADIKAGNTLLSSCQEARVYQGEVEQKYQIDGQRGELHKIGFNDGQGNKRYFYQYHKTQRPDMPLGAPLHFYIASDGIVLKNAVESSIVVFSMALIFSLVLSVVLGGMLTTACTRRIECEAPGKKIRHLLNLLKWVLFIMSIAGVALAANRVHTDFFLPEGKAYVLSVQHNQSDCYLVKAFSPSTDTEFEAEWDFPDKISPATGQEVTVCYPPKSRHVFARNPSGKLYSAVLLLIAFVYMAFTSLILLKGRVHSAA